jgi:O-antigen chain-terminating methyltransferase
LIARVRTNTEPHGYEPKGSGPAIEFGATQQEGGDDATAYTAQELFALPETEFVRASYLALLGREARPDELAPQRDRLLTWQASRLRIVRDLRASPEGRHYDGKIPGLWKIVFRDRLYWSPPAKLGRATWRGIEFLLHLKRRLEADEHTLASAMAAIANIQANVANDRRTALTQTRHVQERISAVRQQGEDGRKQIEQRVAKVNAALNAMEASHTELQRDLSTRLLDHWRAIADQKLRSEALMAIMQARSPPAIDGAESNSIRRETEHLLDPLYLSFEDRYRGSRSDVKERHRVYLRRVEDCVRATGAGAVIDLGCGRGEWLELLSEAGIAVAGYDLNRIAVEECRGRGLNAVLGDGLLALQRESESSLSVITAFHLIEHLAFETLVSMLDHALRALRPGGLLILETPNPANLLVAAERFYLDPTHRNPLPSELVSYLLGARGFANIEVLPLHPVNWPTDREYEDPMLKLLHDKLFGPQDYGAIACKAASP